MMAAYWKRFVKSAVGHSIQSEYLIASFSCTKPMGDVGRNTKGCVTRGTYKQPIPGNSQRDKAFSYFPWGL